MNAFMALDFETADRGRDSACAIGLVRVEYGQIIYRASYLIRPPRDIFEFTYIHGIRWNDGLLSSFRPQRGQQSRRGTS
jgi:DNA polymerase-3 subunit epsilon